MTTMNTAPGDPPVTRLDNMDFGATEPDNTGLYVPKGETSMQPRFVLPYCDGPVRSHAVVALTESAHLLERQRSWKMLHIMAANGDEMAQAVLEALQGFTLGG